MSTPIFTEWSRCDPIEIISDWPIEAPDLEREPLVMVAVVGQTPAVVTETLWRLFEDGQEPRRIVLFTTDDGAKKMFAKYLQKIPERHRARALSFWDGAGYKPWVEDDLVLALCRLCRERQRRVPRLEPHIARRADGTPLPDIRTAEDDRRFGNLIFREVRALTEDGQPPLHASIAGGRKSMSTRLASVMAMFGRPADTLSHVLVTKREYENEGYWCPSDDEPKVLRLKDNKGDPVDLRLDDKNAVQLVPQRFWPLRGLIDEPILHANSDIDLEELEVAVLAMLEAPSIFFDDLRRTVTVRGRAGFCGSFTLENLHYALYRVLAEARKGLVDAVVEIGNPPPTSYLQALDFSPIGLGSDPTLVDGTARPFQLAATRLFEICEQTGRSPKSTILRHNNIDSPGEKEKKHRPYLSYNSSKINEQIDNQIKYRKVAAHLHIRTHELNDETAIYWHFGLELEPEKIILLPESE